MYIQLNGTISIKMQIDDATVSQEKALELVAEATEKWTESMTYDDDGFISVAEVTSATVVDGDLPGYNDLPGIVIDWNDFDVEEES